MIKWNTIYWTLSALGGLYAIFISLLLNTQLQRHALYAHIFHTAWWHDINRPEFFGFAGGQVTPFRISTADGESLYAWHVLPLGLYAKESKNIDWESARPSRELSNYPLERNKAFSMLQRPDVRLIINFHGNAGHLAQGWRPDAYKTMPSIDPDRIHILTFDYRGFGNSTGSPTEEGLIQDGIAVVDWALNTAKVAPHNILLVGQSLGTAVATAVLEHFSTKHSQLTLGGLLLTSGFADLPMLLQTYAIAGFIPILYPMKPYPPLLQYFSDRIADTWNTTARLNRIAAAPSPTRIRILHARNDYDIRWRHSDLLFDAAVAGLDASVGACPSDKKLRRAEDSLPSRELAMPYSKEIFSHRVAYQPCGGRADGRKYLLPAERVSRTVLIFGGHNGVLGLNYAAVAIKELFDAAEQEAKGKTAPV